MREMAEARLVLTDAVIEESLRRGKAAERALAAGEEPDPEAAILPPGPAPRAARPPKPRRIDNPARKPRR
jgi:ribosome maturation factor RimP